MAPVLVLVRHAERQDYVNRSAAWMDAAERPWDTPLTKHGHTQGQVAGAEIRRQLQERGLPLPARLVSSPFLRCVETSVGMRTGLQPPKAEAEAEAEAEAIAAAPVPVSASDSDGLSPSDSDGLSPTVEAAASVPISVENGLCEGMTEDWYRSWALVGVSDSTWGGPSAEFGSGTGFANVTLRPQASVPSVELLNKATCFPESWAIDTAHETAFAPTFTAQAPEHHATMTQRLAECAAAFATRSPDETTVLCSHGGPIGCLFEHLTGERPKRVGFTSVSILQLKEGADLAVAHGKACFTPLLANSTEHVPSSDDLGFAATE